MNRQPYFFKIQFLILFLLILCILTSYLLSKMNLLIVLLFYSNIILIYTFLPFIRSKLKYPWVLHCCLFHLCLYLPIFLLDIVVDKTKKSNINVIFLSILVIIALYLINYKEIKYKLLAKNIITSRGATTLVGFLHETFWSIISIFGEELFFRFFLICYLEHSLGIYSVAVSAILFFLIHPVGRWANVLFSPKVYSSNILLGIFLGLIFYFTKSFLSCILIHSLFNLPEILSSFRQYRLKTRKEEAFFDDY